MIFREARRLYWGCEGGFSEVGDVIDGSVIVVSGLVEDSAVCEELSKRTWTLARRFCGREEM